jgi:hypothetical protein
MAKEIMNADEMMTSEQRVASNLRENVFRNNLDAPGPLSEQRKEELEKEIGDVAKVLNGYGRPWFTAGGTALELAKGKLTRDHLDNDIAIFYEGVGEFFGYASHLGYRFFDVKGKRIKAAEELLAQKGNAFVVKNDKGRPGLRFEIIFLRRNAQGDITFGHNKQFAFSKTLYENPAKTIAVNGEVVPIQPKEIVLLHKIYDGRNKDFHDIKKFLPTLTPEERERLNGYLKTLDATFAVGDRQTTNLDELLQLAEAETKDFREMLSTKVVDWIIGADLGRFDETIEKSFEIAMRHGSPKYFINELADELGERETTWQVAELDKAEKFLFRDPQPTKEEFKLAFSPEPHIEQRFKRKVFAMPRWKCRLKMTKFEVIIACWRVCAASLAPLHAVYGFFKSFVLN